MGFAPSLELRGGAWVSLYVLAFALQTDTLALGSLRKL